MHHRSFDDFLDHLLFARCSLQLIKAEQTTVQNPLAEQMQQGTITVDEFARARTLGIRSWSEFTLEQALAQCTQRHNHQSVLGYVRRTNQATTRTIFQSTRTASEL